jgi:hypothetical protein
MLTRTVISPSTIEKIRMDPSTGKHMANYLRENGLLLINRDELDVLAKKLPIEIWKRLENDILKNRLARSPWIPGSEITQPEVALSESGSDAAHGAISTQVDDYLETAPVARRLRLKSGEEKCRNREDFWLWQMEPIVASLPLRHRRVDVIDPYLFHHLHNAEQDAKGTPTVSDLGLIWLLRQLRGTTNTSSSMIVNLYVMETSPRGDPCIDLARINELCLRYLSSTTNDSFGIRVHVIRHRNSNKTPTDLRDATHGRRIFFNESRMFVLDKGLEDLSKIHRGGYVGDRIGSTLTYLPMASDHYKNEFVGVIRNNYADLLWKDRPEYIIAV